MKRGKIFVESLKLAQSKHDIIRHAQFDPMMK